MMFTSFSKLPKWQRTSLLTDTNKEKKHIKLTQESSGTYGSNKWNLTNKSIKNELETANMEKILMSSMCAKNVHDGQNNIKCRN